MQEKKYGTERLLWALYRNIDGRKLKELARLINYNEHQLKLDIEAIQYVIVLNKDEIIRVAIEEDDDDE